ncbi:MAG: response regulator transcription factor [Anaerolineae bacterium]|nr:response regulator transcription factor [Anaerolineae bacterium]MCB0224544.1 response regulator transcription factor [Anaerolineae bacterium]MCB9105921.1 response regulator transcription factor [Anaerolineales bacterium]
MTYKILVVDDEKTLRHFLRLHLQANGYQVIEAADGREAMSLISRNRFDVALVDLRLTDMDGLEVMRHLRHHEPHTSVIILTGHATVNSAVEALRQGAHDYLLKPCNTAELLTSVADAIARQPASPEPQVNGPEIIEIGELKVNKASRQVTRAGEMINLTPTEFDILTTLMTQPDTAIDSITLVKIVRGYEATEADARAIARVHVHRLRHKLEFDPAKPQYLITVAGGRYLLRSH